MRPPFVRAAPSDIERYGGTAGAAAAAVVLALIQWRCETPGPAREEDSSGCLWWRVSLADLSADAGLTKDATRTALSKLLGDGTVVAKQSARAADQTRAYRAARLTSALTSQLGDLTRSDLPVGGNATVGVEKSHGTVVDLPPALPIETLETRRDRAGARVCQPDKTAPAGGKHPPSKCPDHPKPQHWCRRCRARVAWDENEAEAKRAAVVAVRKDHVSACDQCDHNGMRHEDGGGRCRLHPNIDDPQGLHMVAP